MHDIDRIRLETQQPETGMFEAGPFEAEQFEFAQTGTPSGETGEVFSETEQMELASELLEITSKKLNWISSSARSLAVPATRSESSSNHPKERRSVASPQGAARQALPEVGSAVGGVLGGPREQDLAVTLRLRPAEPSVWNSRG